MDIKEYIESGILEQYCLGSVTDEEQAFLIQMCMLYPEVKKELEGIEIFFEKLCAQNAVPPNGALKNKILNSLNFSGKLLDINNLPDTTPESDHESWLLTLDHLIPQYPQDDFLCHVLHHSDQITQMLVVTKNDVPEETHDDQLESFFILKGVCQCVVDGELFTLQAGSFLEIPLYKTHDIKIVSPYVVAILQKKATTA